MSRRSYDRQFKIAAVKLVLEDSMPVAQVAKELSIHYNSLYRWISEYEEYGESAFLWTCFKVPNVSNLYLSFLEGHYFVEDSNKHEDYALECLGCEWQTKPYTFTPMKAYKLMPQTIQLKSNTAIGLC